MVVLKDIDPWLDGGIIGQRKKCDWKYGNDAAGMIRSQCVD